MRRSLLGPRGPNGMLLLFVPAGEFWMGSGGLGGIRTSGRLPVGNLGLHLFPDERPPLAIHLEAFWVAGSLRGGP